MHSLLMHIRPKTIGGNFTPGLTYPLSSTADLSYYEFLIVHKSGTTYTYRHPCTTYMHTHTCQLDCNGYDAAFGIIITKNRKFLPLNFGKRNSIPDFGFMSGGCIKSAILTICSSFSFRWGKA